jgi:hypothetical protein
MINPWAGLLLLIAIGLFIVCYKGTQDNVIAAVKGQPYGNSNLEGTKSINATIVTPQQFQQETGQSP